MPFPWAFAFLLFLSGFLGTFYNSNPIVTTMTMPFIELHPGPNISNESPLYFTALNFHMNSVSHTIHPSTSNVLTNVHAGHAFPSTASST